MKRSASHTVKSMLDSFFRLEAAGLAQEPMKWPVPYVVKHGIESLLAFEYNQVGTGAYEGVCHCTINSFFRLEAAGLAQEPMKWPVPYVV
ncbi:MAG: hypothetical protein LBF76_00960, partial [Holosporales bacterium]|nr:hypothetical protein [Holosporales bacterium]